MSGPILRRVLRSATVAPGLSLSVGADGEVRVLDGSLSADERDCRIVVGPADLFVEDTSGTAWSGSLVALAADLRALAEYRRIVADALAQPRVPDDSRKPGDS